MSKLTENETELRNRIRILLLAFAHDYVEPADVISDSVLFETTNLFMTLITSDKQKLLQGLIVYVETYNDYDPEGLFYRSEDAIPLPVIQNKLEGLA
jgi:hypothetical protein